MKTLPAKTLLALVFLFLCGSVFAVREYRSTRPHFRLLAGEHFVQVSHAGQLLSFGDTRSELASIWERNLMPHFSRRSVSSIESIPEGQTLSYLNWRVIGLCEGLWKGVFASEKDPIEVLFIAPLTEEALSECLIAHQSLTSDWWISQDLDYHPQIPDPRSGVVLLGTQKARADFRTWAQERHIPLLLPQKLQAVRIEPQDTTFRVWTYPLGT